MKNTSADTLEFNGLVAVVGRYVSSAMGRRLLAGVAPTAERGRLEGSLAEAGEAIAYLRASSKPQPAGRGAAIRLDFSSLPDLGAAVEKIRIEGASLEGRELFFLLGVLDRAADMKSVLDAVAGRFPRLGARGASIGDFRLVLRELAGKVRPDGGVDDHASAALHRIRREIERQKKAIQDSLERFLRQHQEDGTVQEEIVTIRNERFVVPIVAGQRRKIDGVIHGASSSGHTLFVEPMATIDLNNELVRLAEEELRETHRILREITERLRGYAESIQRTMATLAELELVFAKARFALDFDCVIPRFSDPASPRLLLREARHPLLEDVLKAQGKAVVPLTVELDRERRTLLISGPNTGGKTVSLKTAGLLVLMAQSGLPVPAAEAEIPLFEQVLADIGDNQSIEQSLSTFSAHVAHIREMVLDATPDSLVLLDELGAATDPEEGGALGVAVVDHFRAAGAFTLASTHLLPLKIYGANTPQVLNASMGFDEETLAPTYEMRVGVPGKSAGLDIATRLGMPAHIMERARQSMSSRERDLSRFLAELQRRLEDARLLEEDLRKRQRDLAEREQQLARDWEKKEKAKLADLERRLEQVIERFESASQETLEKIRDSAGQARAAARQVSRAKRELREEFENNVLANAAGVPAETPKIEEGARVRLKGIREVARVRRRLGEDRIEVEAGFLKMQVPLDDIVEVLPPAGETPKLPKNVTYRPGPQLNPAVKEINVIGERAEDARDRVERFLDQAVMATASRVRIVHGHGMGILRRTIWELLASSPHVEKYYAAEAFEGGAGATIVELKE